MMKDPVEGVEVKTRTYLLKEYKVSVNNILQDHLK